MKEYKWNYDYADNINDNKNQYSPEECMQCGPVDAKYIKNPNIEFNGNPFIEALPLPRDGQLITNAYFKPIPQVDRDKLKGMSALEKKAMIIGLKSLRFPLSFHKQLEFVNYDAIVSSYALRRPYCWYDSQNEKTTVKTKGFIGDSAPSGFSLLGYSGCGKSSSIKQLTDNIPQLIIHHPEPHIRIPQITYLIISCVPNSNFQSLYQQIGEAIDFIFDYPEPVYEKMILKCRSLGAKQLKVCELIEKFSIGTIILDEIQLIDFDKNKENSFEGLLSIVNRTKVALSVIGTDDAYHMLFAGLRNARRSGDLIAADKYIEQRDYFDKLTKMLFRWQWFDDIVDWTPELSEALYNATQGIINQLIWLYKWMNLDYLDAKDRGRKVVIDSEFVKKTAKTHFKQLDPHIAYIQRVQIERQSDELIEDAVNKQNSKQYKMVELEEKDVDHEIQMITQVNKLIRPMYPQYNSDLIAIHVKEIIRNDLSKDLEPYEIAQQTLSKLENKPARKRRSRKKDMSTDICDYL